MTTASVRTLEQLGDWLLTADVHAPEWQHASGCDGWTNLDILLHLTCTMRELVEPTTLPEPVLDSIERTNDVQVEAFRGATPEQAIDEYRRLLPGALEVLSELQSDAHADETFDILDAGVYPVHLSSDALVFDHFCHLTLDSTLGAALTPCPPRLGDDALAISIGWLIAGLPQMSGPRLAEGLTEPVGLKILGPGGGMWSMTSSGIAGERIECARVEFLPVTAIVTDALDFMTWGTLRRSVTDASPTFTGDQQLAASVAAAIHVY